MRDAAPVVTPICDGVGIERVYVVLAEFAHGIVNLAGIDERSIFSSSVSDNDDAGGDARWLR